MAQHKIVLYFKLEDIGLAFNAMASLNKYTRIRSRLKLPDLTEIDSPFRLIRFSSKEPQPEEYFYFLQAGQANITREFQTAFWYRVDEHLRDFMVNLDSGLDETSRKALITGNTRIIEGVEWFCNEFMTCRIELGTHYVNLTNYSDKSLVNDLILNSSGFANTYINILKKARGLFGIISPDVDSDPTTVEGIQVLGDPHKRQLPIVELVPHVDRSVRGIDRAVAYLYPQILALWDQDNKT